MKPSPDKEGVVLLHGLGRTRRSLLRLEARLAGLGYTTINRTYPSTRRSIEDLALGFLGGILNGEVAGRYEKVHFVTHSLGGIIARRYLQDHPAPPGSRLVMLSPPNQGSELAELMGGSRLFGWLVGPAGRAVAQGAAGPLGGLGRLDLEVGVIAGDRPRWSLFSRFFPGPHDGKISVERTRLPEMTDFLVAPRGHTFIMNDPRVMAQVVFFLRHGRFERQGPGAAAST
ncbi:MAG: hypothetical protein AB1896_10400 [Thermodesulfobacteriota bacterium]